MKHTGAVKIFVGTTHQMPNTKPKRVRNKKISIWSEIYLWLKIIIMKLILF